MYKTGDIPNDFNVNKTITVPKKAVRQMRELPYYPPDGTCV